MQQEERKSVQHKLRHCGTMGAGVGGGGGGGGGGSRGKYSVLSFSPSSFKCRGDSLLWYVDIDETVSAHRNM